METVSGHESSSLSAYLRVLRRRPWLILGCALLVPLAAYILSVQQTKRYESSAEVYLNRQNIASALTGIADTTLLVDENREAETQANLAIVPDVAHLALKRAGITDMTPEDLLRESSVTSKGVSDILEFKVTNPDPAKASRLASAYADAFAQYRGELDTASVTKARQEVDRKLAQLTTDGNKGSALYNSFAEKEQQLATLETLKTSRATVVRRADEAVQIAPRPKRNAVLGLLIGLVLGVGFAFAIDAIDTRVRSATEVAERLGLSLLARIPRPPKGFSKERRLVMLAQPTGANAESFRMLRTNLEFALLGLDGVRTILITSAVEQEGKSTTAANLAIAEARAGRRVLLVDLDLRRPFLDRFFHLMHAEGITSVALGEVELEAALHPIELATGEPVSEHGIHSKMNGHVERGTLAVLTSGPRPPDPGEFVGTRRLAEILTRLRDRYDLVLIDTPPVLRVGDAMTLSAHADAILVVTRLNLIRRPMLAELRRLLETTPVPKLGYVVTGSQDGEPTGYGYYGYGGYGYGDPDELREEQSTDANAPTAAKQADRA